VLCALVLIAALATGRRALVVRLVHWEIFKETFFLFLLCLVSLLAIIVIGRILQLREMFMGLDLSITDLGVLFFFLSPFFLLLLVPVACMLSVFLTFLRMSTDRELIALKSSGLSLYRLLPAPMLLCILCTVATMFVSFYGLSWGINNFRSSVVEYARTRTQLIIQAGVFNQQFPGLMITARQVDNTRGVLQDILVEDQTNEGVTATILADVGKIQTVPSRGEILIALEDGHIYRQDREKISVLGFGRYLVRLDLSRLLGDFEFFDLYDAQPRELSFKQLKELEAHPELIERYNYDDKDYRKIKVEIHKRIALPFACLVLGLFAMPMACMFEGMARQHGLILALGLFLVYYSLLSFGWSLGETGVMHPGAALWLPNITFLFVGLIALHLTAREKSLRLFSGLSHLSRRLWTKESS